MIIILLGLGSYLWPKMKEFIVKIGLNQVTPSQWIWTLTSGLGIWMAWKIFSKYLKRKKVQKLIDLKWSQRKNQVKVLKEKLEILDQIELWQEIWNKSFEDLHQELQIGSLKAVDVLHAFQWKALESNDKLNNIVWFIQGSKSKHHSFFGFDKT